MENYNMDDIDKIIEEVNLKLSKETGIKRGEMFNNDESSMYDDFESVDLEAQGELAFELGLTIKDLHIKLRDTKWRINNLYHVRDEQGLKVKFKMRPVQEYLFNNLWFRNIIPKSRQHGITTMMSILALDQCIFRSNYTAAIIAQDQDTMRKIFRRTIKFAWDSFPPVLKTTFSDTETENASEIVFGNKSSIAVTLSTRSGTPQFLHISELGPIAAKSPEKAEEIRSGALNSSHSGNMITIESTAKGSTGLFAELCYKAKDLFDEDPTGENLTPIDFKLFFFPWWKDPKNTTPEEYLDRITLTQSTKDYFETISEVTEGHVFTKAQKSWWQKKADEQKGAMSEEQPSTFEESFSTMIKHAYYKREISDMIKEGRVRDISVNHDYYIYTAWDLGMNDTNPIIFFQFIDGNVYIIDAYKNSGAGLGHYVKIMESKGYRYGGHMLPHDVMVKELGSGITRKQSLYNLGMRNISVQKQHKQKEGFNFLDGIEQVRQIFSRIYIDKSRCTGKGSFLESIMNYQQAVNPKTGEATGTHKKNGHQHFADALRVLATTFRFVEIRMSVNGDRKANSNMVQITNSFG